MIKHDLTGDKSPGIQYNSLPMKCKICGREAFVKLRSYNLALCEDHFVEFVKRRVEKAIKKFKMVSREDHILVAVSGGKDSIVLWHVLNELGYRTTGYFLNLGISEFSEESQEIAEEFASKFSLELKVEYLRDVLGVGIPEIAKISRGKPCSTCGMIKRYLINRAGLEYDAVATGHNLDDESSVLFGNIIHWQVEYLERQSPVLPKDRTLSKKIKPLVLLTNQEVKLYADLLNLPYIRDKCPFSGGATTHYYRDILQNLEDRMPGTKIRFYLGFLENKKGFKVKEKELKPCERCGYLTTAGVCSFCRLKERIQTQFNLR